MQLEENFLILVSSAVLRHLIRHKTSIIEVYSKRCIKLQHCWHYSTYYTCTFLRECNVLAAMHASHVRLSLARELYLSSPSNLLQYCTFFTQQSRAKLDTVDNISRTPHPHQVITQLEGTDIFLAVFRP